MTVIPRNIFRCDGCQNDSEKKEFLVVHYEINKHIPGKPNTRYTRDYCDGCADLIRAQLSEGAFKKKVRNDLV